MKVGKQMKKLYEDLQGKVLSYTENTSMENESKLIDSLDNLINELFYTIQNPGVSYFEKKVNANKYRNIALVIINDFVNGDLLYFPENFEQFDILVYQFSNRTLVNPIHTLGSQMKLDLDKPQEERDYDNDEWELMLDYSSKLATYWDGHEISNIGDIYGQLYEDFPRTGVLKYWNYGLIPQSLVDLRQSFENKLTKSTYLEDAEDSLIDKTDVEYLIHLKYYEPEVYNEMILDEVDALQYEIDEDDDLELEDIVLEEAEGQEVVD